MSFSNVWSMARALRRRPAFTLAAVISLSAGIGVTTTVLSVVNGVLLRPLPYNEPDRLTSIWPGKFLANRELAALRERSKSYSAVTAFSPGWLMSLTGVTPPRQLNAARVSGNFFDMLGTRPALGRTFGMDAEIPGQDRLAVLSHELWQVTFGGDPAIVGRSITLDGVAFAVVAVMPRDFRTFDFGTDLWTPMTMDQSAMSWAGATSFVYAKLAPGTTTVSASTELAALVAQMQADFQLAADWTAGARVVGLQEDMVGGLRSTVLVLFAAVGFLLLIAAANVANLLFVRTLERRHELAVRASLGAAPRRLASLLMGESLLIGALGGAAGILLAVGGVKLLHAILPADLPRLPEIALDARVLAGAVLITLLTVLVFGTGPALQGSGASLIARIRAGRTIAGTGARTRGAVVSIEVALAVILSIGAVLMGRSLVALHKVDPGLRTENLLTMKLQPSNLPSNEAYRAYWEDLFARLRAIPGVSSAATILHLPTSGRSWGANVEVENRPLEPGQAPPRSAWQVVSTAYFEVAGVPVLRGRPFAETDRADQPRVIAVNESFADRLFPGEDAVGRRIRAGNATQQQWAEIIAVVGGVRHDSLNVPPAPEVYVPFSQRVVVANSLLIRASSDPVALMPAIREAIWSINRNVPISDVRTMDDRYSTSLARQRMVLILLAVFAIVGLVLSAVGIYGVVAYGVRQRLREIGIRVALGADAGAIRRLVLGEGLRYAAAGIAAGILLALALAGVMRGLLFGVPGRDPLSFAVVPIALLLVAMGASWLPARQAATADPTDALRVD